MRNLLARNAFYLNVTNSSWVKNDHSYFKGQPVSRNSKLKAMFAGLFEGRTVEDSLDYRVDLNAYELK